MTVMFLLWFAIGAATGALHTAGLWRRAHRVARPEWSFPSRMPLVAITLVIAALVGRILPAAIGWAIGLAMTSVVFVSRQRRWM